MNKKTLIFSLSTILFFALSFVVYSFTEPTTMPSSYNPPINTSSTTQTKTGEIGASLFRDADNSTYYINPSGNSVLSGDITTSGNIITAYPTEVGHVVTKGYVDDLFNNAGSGPASYEVVEGTTCPEGAILISKYYEQKTCTYSHADCTYENNCCRNPIVHRTFSSAASGWGSSSSDTQTKRHVADMSCSPSGACDQGCVGTRVGNGWVETCESDLTHVLCLTVDAPQ